MSQTNIAPSQASARNRLWHYIAYYGMSEMAQRGTRIITTALLARLLTPLDFGVAAIAMTCFELIRVMANAVIAQAVIRVTEERLAGTCITAWRLMWLLCIALAAIQTLIGAAIAFWIGRMDVFIMVSALACIYLTMPPALVQYYLLMRADGHRTIATIAASQAIADNVITIILALLGFGPWAVVLPKLATTPIWTIGMRRAQKWSADKSVQPVPARELLQYALPVLGVEILTASRMQFDKVLVGAILGIEALGIYYFVFNAGIGLSMALTNALSYSLYPHFAAVAASPEQLWTRLNDSLLRKAAPIAGAVLLQAAMAPIYVPILFGAKWTASAWMVSVLCISQCCKVFADTGAQALRAAGNTPFELKGTLAITAFSLTALAAGLTQSLGTGVVALALASSIAHLGFAVAARYRICTSANSSRHASLEVAA